MKAKQKQKPAPQRKPRKKPQFEDGVRAALVAGAVICAAVLGVGGFFAVRSVLVKDQTEIPAVSGSAGARSGAESAGPDAGGAESPAETDPAFPSAGIPDTAGGTDLIPELDEAIRSLDALGGTGQPGPASAGTAPSGTNSTAMGASGAAGKQPILPADRRGILVLVIDDAGNNLRDLEPFLDFPGPLTIAVLPGLPNSAEAARRVRAAGKELFLHQPMEALNGQDQGPGAIKSGMNPAEVKAILLKNLNEIGPVAGFNNHEGSRATMDPAIMKPVLEVSRDSGLRFLDSRTIAGTAAPKTAKELGIAIAQRDIFLDNEQDRESMLAAVEAGCKKAELNGAAVMIGHAWSPELAALLAELYPQLVRRGFFFTTVSGILDPGK